MSSISAGGGAGIHPGKPIIWPKDEVKKTSSSEETQQSRQNVSSSTPKTSAPSTSSAASAASAAASASQVQEDILRPLEQQDIHKAMFELGVPNTVENNQLAKFMTQYGLPLNADNFQELFRLLNGKKNTHSLESSVISLLKDIKGSTRSVDALSQFLNNPQIAQKMSELQASIINMKALAQTQAHLPTSTMNGLVSVLAGMDKEIQKRLKNFTNDQPNLENLKKSGLISDLKALNQFISGLEQKLVSENKLGTLEGRAFQSQLQQFKTQIKDTLNQILAQSILSHHTDRQLSGAQDSYEYWMIPNIFGQGNKPIELAIQKDRKKRKGKFDPEKTRLMLKLETPVLGEISFVIDVADKKLWYVINTSNEPTKQLAVRLSKTLKEALEAHDFKVEAIQTILKKMNIKTVILPKQHLDDIIRINTEV